MRSGPATQTAFVRGFLLCRVTAWWRNDCFSPTALQKECCICQSQSPVRHLTITNPQPFTVASGPSPAFCFKEQRARGEEAATPGQPVALARVFWSVRQRFTLENRRLPLALPQSFGKRRNSHVSLNLLSARLLPLAIQKTCAVVQKLWRMRLPCGSRRKSKN